jgi:O-antigen ligase
MFSCIEKRISWILIVIVRIQNVFAWLIVGILYKNLTLTNRTVIWDNALGSIKKRPLLGYGVQNTVNLFYTYIFRFGKPAVNSWLSAHNQVLQTLYESGIVSMIPIMLLIIIALKRLDDNKKNKMYPAMVAGIIGLSVSLMAEAPGWDSVFILLTLAYHIRKIPTAIDHDWEKMDDKCCCSYI